MVQIVWSDSAKAQLKEIYDYYNLVAGKRIAKAIKLKIINKPHLLANHPDIGQIEDNPMVISKGFRYLIEGNYKIVYKVYVEDKSILISAVFDTRQNPTKLKV